MSDQQNYKNCPACGEKLKGLMSSRHIIEPSSSNIINSYYKSTSEAHCNECAASLVTDARYKLTTKIQGLIKIIPIITVNNPVGWEYNILSMVSSQSVSGTGFISEISSSWSDFLGSQSNALNDKIDKGESICKDKLRYKAAQIGGNAIIGTDIDYAEVGSGRGMMMVCMSGTAIKINNISTVFPETKADFEDLSHSVESMNSLNKIKLYNL